MRHPESRGHQFNVIMATVTPRQTLVFEIQKRLSELSASQLRSVVSYIDTTSRADELSEPELYDLIVDYIRGEELTALENEGMAQLLSFNDMLSDLLATDPGVGEVKFGDSTSHQQGSSTPPYPDHNQPDGYPSPPTTDSSTPPPPIDRDIHPGTSPTRRDTGLPAENLATSMPAKALSTGVGGALPGRVSLATSMGDQVLRVKDFAALLPRRQWGK